MLTTIALLLCAALMFPSPATAQPACTAHSFSAANLSGMQMLGDDYMLKTPTPEACMQACCAAASHCMAWNYHVSSTDPTHHPRECWLSNSSSPVVQTGERSDVWVGGSKVKVRHGHSGGGRTGGGAAIQPLSKWYYFGAAGSLQGTLNRELTDQSVSLLHSRASSVVSLGSDKQKWLSRQAKVFEAFGGTGSGPFAPMPPPNRSPPKYNVTKTLRRPGYTCELILYETRPGFYASGAIWTPTKLKQQKGGKAPGVLMVSGHTSDGFRSNNLGGPTSANDPPDDDYQVVEINLVARGFVVLAFDPIGQGERMQYADIKEGRPDPAAPWGKGAAGSYLWGSTSDHEYIGRQLLLNGVGLMSFWLHDEMISLDLLESLPQVDADSLGVVGCSGGGTQSSYLGAMDSRVKAASMACYISTKEIDMLWNAGGGGDGEQTWPHGIFNGLDKPDLIEVRANQSTQVLITSADADFPAAGGLAAVAEAQSAYAALGGELHVFEGVWHHGWVLPTREQINAFFCKSLAAGFLGGWTSAGCDNSTEVDVSAENPSFLEWNDEQLKVTSTGQINTAPECIAPGAHISKTVHNFSADLTEAHLLALTQQRKQPATFLSKVIEKAPMLSGFIPFGGMFSPGNPRFLGAQFVVPRPPGCIPGRYIPGCPNPPIASTVPSSGLEDTSKSRQELVDGPIGLVEQWQVLTEGQCFALVTIYFPASVQDMTAPRKKMPLVVWYSAAVASASAPPDAASQWASAGHAFAMVELCGFGTTGPRCALFFSLLSHTAFGWRQSELRDSRSSRRVAL